jgi:Tfp pilus assembly protein PilF
MHAIFRNYWLAGLVLGAVLTAVGVSSYALYSFAQTAQVWRLYQEDRLSFASVFFMRGNYFFGDGDYNLPTAMAYYNRALRYENSTNEPIYYQIGRVHFIRGDLDAALKAFNEQIAQNPSYMKSYYMRGLTYGYQNNFTSAADDFKTFLISKPESWAAHNDLVWILFRAGEYDSAEQYARKGLVFAPGNPWLSNALGGILINQKRFAEAIAPLTTARDGFTAMTAEDWGNAYPGNDPRVYGEGRTASIRSAEENLARAQSALAGE